MILHVIYATIPEDEESNVPIWLVEDKGEAAKNVMDTLRERWSGCKFQSDIWDGPVGTSERAVYCKIQEVHYGRFGDGYQHLQKTAEIIGNSLPKASQGPPPEAEVWENFSKLIPVLDIGSDDWVSNKSAAKLLGIKTSTLRNHRSKGLSRKDNNDTFGCHSDYCFWRKDGRNHPCYYLPMMKQNAGHLGRIYPKSRLDFP